MGFGAEGSGFVAIGGHDAGVWFAALDADGTHMVTALNNTVLVWDLRVKPPSFVALVGHEDVVVNSAASNSDGMHVITASEGKTAAVWDLRVDPPSFIALEGHKGGSPLRSSAARELTW
jgi:WD40 repeat protein